MAKTLLTNVTPFYGALLLPALTNQLGIEVTVEAKEVTNFASRGARELLGGIIGTDWTLDGFWDADSASEPDASLFSGAGQSGIPASATLTYPVADGDVVYFANVLNTKYAQPQEVGEPGKFSLALSSTAPTVRGRVLDTRTATASGNGTALQLGAVLSTQRLYYAAHVDSKSGTNPTLDLVIQSDNAGGFGSAAQVATLAQFTGTGYAYGTVDGPITDDYFRVARTIGGTDTPTFHYTLVIAIGPKP